MRRDRDFFEEPEKLFFSLLRNKSDTRDLQGTARKGLVTPERLNIALSGVIFRIALKKGI
jgi:hypothetical protein